MELTRLNNPEEEYWRNIIKEYAPAGKVYIPGLLDYLNDNSDGNTLTEDVIKKLFEKADVKEELSHDAFLKIVLNVPDISMFTTCLNMYFVFVKYVIPPEKKKILRKVDELIIEEQPIRMLKKQALSRTAILPRIELQSKRIDEDFEKEEYLTRSVRQSSIIMPVVSEPQIQIEYSSGDVDDQYNCNPPPVFILSITIIQIACHFIEQGLGFPSDATGPVAVLMVYDPKKRMEMWRYLTYMFVHIGNFHLIINVVIQLLLGLPLESFNKWAGTMSVYLLGVIAGSLGTYITDPTTRLSGASGGVYALMTAHISSIILNWNEMENAFVHLTLFAILITCDIGVSAYSMQNQTMLTNSIGIAAHFFGGLAGLLVGVFVLRNINVKRFEKVIKAFAFIMFLILIISAILCNAFSLHKL